MVTMTNGTAIPSYGHVQSDELRRFCWAVLSDIDPESASDLLGPENDDEQARHAIKRFLGVDPMSAKILLCLIRNGGTILPRDVIQETCGCSGDPKTVDVYIHRLRAGLRDQGIEVTIESVWGVGYGVMIDQAKKLLSEMSLI